LVKERRLSPDSSADVAQDVTRRQVEPSVAAAGR